MGFSAQNLSISTGLLLEDPFRGDCRLPRWQGNERPCSIARDGVYFLMHGVTPENFGDNIVVASRLRGKCHSINKILSHPRGRTTTSSGTRRSDCPWYGDWCCWRRGLVKRDVGGGCNCSIRLMSVEVVAGLDGIRPV
jgi:hypothetical protein